VEGFGGTHDLSGSQSLRRFPGCVGIGMPMLLYSVFSIILDFQHFHIRKCQKAFPMSVGVLASPMSINHEVFGLKHRL